LPLRVPDPDALARALRRDAVAHHLDHARAVAVRDDPGKGDLAGAALAVFHVGWIDAGGLELDAALAGPRNRRVHIAHLEHVAGRAVSFVERRTHSTTPGYGLLCRLRDAPAMAFRPRVPTCAITQSGDGQ